MKVFVGARELSGGITQIIGSKPNKPNTVYYAANKSRNSKNIFVVQVCLFIILVSRCWGLDKSCQVVAPEQETLSRIIRQQADVSHTNLKSPTSPKVWVPWSPSRDYCVGTSTRINKPTRNGDRPVATAIKRGVKPPQTSWATSSCLRLRV